MHLEHQLFKSLQVVDLEGCSQQEKRVRLSFARTPFQLMDKSNRGGITHPRASSNKHWCCYCPRCCLFWACPAEKGRQRTAAASPAPGGRPPERITAASVTRPRIYVQDHRRIRVGLRGYFLILLGPKPSPCKIEWTFMRSDFLVNGFSMKDASSVTTPCRPTRSPLYPDMNRQRILGWPAWASLASSAPLRPGMTTSVSSKLISS